MLTEIDKVLEHVVMAFVKTSVARFFKAMLMTSILVWTVILHKKERILDKEINRKDIFISFTMRISRNSCSVFTNI